MTLPSPLVLVDLETTGANPVRDRITEIAIVRVEHGEVVARWQSLVNPQCSIPGLIQRLIGITDAMVADAPTFAQLAAPVRELLAGAVFVAHNARFDYGFLCNEYDRIGQRFDASVLCTVKLSRALYPEYHRHGLDALIERHGFVCDARHRAMGDAEVLLQFMRQVEDGFDSDTLARACTKAMKVPPRPPGLPEGALEGLPDAPGVYQLFGEAPQPLLTGRANSLRARVMEHFAALGGKGKDAQLVSQVRRVEWQQTAGELEAWLRELSLERRMPAAPRGPGRPRQGGQPDEVFGLRLVPGRKRAPILARVPLHDTDPATWDDVYGTFRNGKEADAALRELAGMYQLCPRRLGLEPNGKGPCTAHPLKRCAGVCAGRETPAEHDQRVAGALGALQLKPWPWAGAVVVSEQAADGERQAHHVFDRWCHLGSAESEAGLQALLDTLPPRHFDIDIYRLLQRWLGGDGNAGRAKPLPA